MKGKTDMYEKLNGIEIVATLADDRPYWRLEAADVHRWVGSLPPSATQGNVSRIECVGEAWDGSSDVVVGEVPWGKDLKARDIDKLLDNLRSGLRALPTDRIAMPTSSSVRICRIASSTLLIIDFDFVDFILPLAINGSQPIGKRAPSMATVAGQMLEFLKGADATRAGVVRRESGMRRALEETAAEIGHGAAPLWLRLGHVPYYDDPRHLLDVGYVVLFATINETLLWAPTGSERIHTVQEVRDHRTYYAQKHAARATVLQGLQATNSVGLISQTALAFIADKGLDPGETLESAISSALADHRNRIHFERGKTSESLHYEDGHLLLSLSFPGGHYYRDCLTIWGDYPPSIIAQAEGKLMRNFLDHVALAGEDLLVTKVEARDGALELYHAIRSVAIPRTHHDAEAMPNAA
ncbi:hypothetical protein [Sphingomonas sp. Leaf230]|uniref:hypothetical protein n=1 Tax=Sphingomonas sp. Leaf230 TaxID=1735694 RepID=UPI0006FDEE24|nr:hypothetical protein [Sphingomonas sp. Leaf230]